MLDLLESTVLIGLNALTVTALSLLDTTTALLPYIGRTVKLFNLLKRKQILFIDIVIATSKAYTLQQQCYKNYNLSLRHRAKKLIVL